MQAGLIIVYASSGRTASLIAKYRPATPILTLVVPQLTSNTLTWSMKGRSLARQCLIIRGRHAIWSPSLGVTGSCMLLDRFTDHGKELM